MSACGPHTPGGCDKCLGAITVVGKNKIERNVAYYTIGHVSRFIVTGATRVACRRNDPALLATALQNPDGSIVIVVLNDSDTEKNCTVGFTDRSIIHLKAEGGSVLSVKW